MYICATKGIEYGIWICEGGGGIAAGNGGGLLRQYPAYGNIDAQRRRQGSTNDGVSGTCRNRIYLP